MLDVQTELRPALPFRRTQARMAAPMTEAAPTGKVMRVLIIDDNAQVRSAVTRFLRLHGLTVDAAPDGRTALTMLSTQPADFILCDVDMPGMSGFEVCRKIKSDPANAFTPIIMLTALDSADDRVRGAEAGCDGYLAKPVPPAELVARVKAGLRQRELVLEAIRVATTSGVKTSQMTAHATAAVAAAF
jgi:DNA-binding response OmpR family regulator